MHFWLNGGSVAPGHWLAKSVPPGVFRRTLIVMYTRIFVEFCPLQMPLFFARTGAYAAAGLPLAAMGHHGWYLLRVTSCPLPGFCVPLTASSSPDRRW